MREGGNRKEREAVAEEIPEPHMHVWTPCASDVDMVLAPRACRWFQCNHPQAKRRHETLAALDGPVACRDQAPARGEADVNRPGNLDRVGSEAQSAKAQ